MTTITRRTMLTTLAAGAAAAATFDPARAQGAAAAKIGAPAPGFSLEDTNGEKVSLADFKGKTVVLEWTNHECPFVKKHYTGAMQALQKKWTDQGVVWLSVISSAPGEQGAVSSEQANKLTADRKAMPTAVLIEPKGEVGRAYGAQVTPHMYIVDGAGTLVYMGGIDDKPSTKVEDLKTAKNFVDAALTEMKQGKPVSITTSRPYGCTIKFMTS